MESVAVCFFLNQVFNNAFFSSTIKKVNSLKTIHILLVDLYKEYMKYILKSNRNYF